MVGLDDDRNEGGDIVIIVIVILMCLFLLKKDVHALRHKCYVVFSSILAIFYSMVKRAFGRGFMLVTAAGKHTNVDDIDIGIKCYASNFTDVLFAFSIIALSFLRRFNATSVC